MRLGELFRRGPGVVAPDFAAIVQGFESFGENCEFGLVQRYAGAEPLGLFRFSGTSDLDRLIHALDTDFAQYGTGDDLTIGGSLATGVTCRSHRYGFGYAVSEIPPETSLDAILAREIRKVAYLKRRLLEDLARGDKIFVRKGVAEEGPHEIARLARAVRRHGASTLLHVVEQDDDSRPDTVRWRGEGVMEGVVRRFAPRETAYVIDLESWLSVCRQADALARGLPVSESRRVPKNLLTTIPPRTVEHVIGRGEALGREDLELFGTPQAAAHLDRDAVHAFSAWVWIPADFDGVRLEAVMSHYRLGWRSADLSVREAWQRIWIGAKVPRDAHGIVLGFVVAGGSAGRRFRSTKWCLEQGPVPAPAQPPSIRIGPGVGA